MSNVHFNIPSPLSVKEALIVISTRERASPNGLDLVLEKLVPDSVGRNQWKGSPSFYNQTTGQFAKFPIGLQRLWPRVYAVESRDVLADYVGSYVALNGYIPQQADFHEAIEETTFSPDPLGFSSCVGMSVPEVVIPSYVVLNGKYGTNSLEVAYGGTGENISELVGNSLFVVGKIHRDATRLYISSGLVKDVLTT